MVWCEVCKDDVEVEEATANGFSCCTGCGTVLESGTFTSDVQFVKGPGGDAGVAGQYVTGDGTRSGRMAGASYGQSDNFDRIAERGREEIDTMAQVVQLPHPREQLTEQAFRMYKLALQHQFTRGRRVDQVAAACLYTVCRIENQPFMLIDFSDALQVNVFVLGNVYLQLVRLLRLQGHPTITRPTDPSLYLDRFAKKLKFGNKTRAVVETALQLVASMKRDWMQTGRRPSGICGAALYLAAHVHGFKRTKHQVITVVHVGEATLSKRVMEFASTSAAELVADDFQEQEKQLDSRQQLYLTGIQPQALVPAEFQDTQCDHLVAKSAAHFFQGMCLDCYKEALQISGGYLTSDAALAGQDPPAYARLRQKEADAIAKKQEQLALEYPEEELRIEEELENTLNDAHLLPFSKLVHEDSQEQGSSEGGNLALPPPASPAQPFKPSPAGSNATAMTRHRSKSPVAAQAAISAQQRRTGSITALASTPSTEKLRALADGMITGKPGSQESPQGHQHQQPLNTNQGHEQRCLSRQEQQNALAEQEHRDHIQRQQQQAGTECVQQQRIARAQWWQEQQQQAGHRDDLLALVVRNESGAGPSEAAQGAGSGALLLSGSQQDGSAAEYSWQEAEGLLRLWASQYVEFDENSFTSNAEVLESFSSFCEARQVEPPPPFRKSSQEVRFAIFVAKLLNSMAERLEHEGMVQRCFVSGKRGFAGVALLECCREASDAVLAAFMTHDGNAAADAVNAVPGADLAADSTLVTTGDVGENAVEEVDTLSDLEDEEIDALIHTEEESKMKEQVWLSMHQEFFEQQQARKAEKEAQEEEDAEREAAGLGRKRKRHMRMDLSAETATAAVTNMLQAKKMSKKINYAALQSLFDKQAGVSEKAASTTKPSSSAVSDTPSRSQVSSELQTPSLHSAGTAVVMSGRTDRQTRGAVRGIALRGSQLLKHSVLHSTELPPPRLMAMTPSSSMQQ